MSNNHVKCKNPNLGLPGQTDVVALFNISDAVELQKSDLSNILKTEDLPTFVQPRINT